MDYITIEVPDMNDSVSRIVLNKTAFSVYDPQSQPIVVGIKIVPKFPLNLFYGVTRLPFGVFGVMTKLDRIGRRDFAGGNAQFVFAPVSAELV